MHGQCEQLSYSYMWGQNIMTGTFYLQGEVSG